MEDYRVSSPSSELFTDNDANSITTRDKPFLKKSESAKHVSNCKSGYIPVSDNNYETNFEMKGRKTFAFWTLVALLSILTVGNLILTTIILNVLRVGKELESIEFISVEDAIKFFGHTDLGHIYKPDGKLEGFKNDPLEITAQDSSIILSISGKNEKPLTKFKMNKNNTLFTGFDFFEIKNKEEKLIYSTNDPDFKFTKTINDFYSNSIKSNRIVSPLNENLKIEGKNLTFKGAEGITIDGRKVKWIADQDIFFKPDNGSIILNSIKGIYFNIRKMPIALVKQNSYSTNPQYKLCVCMPQGKLFKILVPNNHNGKVFCHHISISPQHNPCY